VATSTGAQPADFSKCELDSESKPKLSEYGGNKPKLAAQPKKLTLPTGKSDGAMPEGKLN
jgi:hypothetical protein